MIVYVSKRRLCSSTVFLNKQQEEKKGRINSSHKDLEHKMLIHIQTRM